MTSLITGSSGFIGSHLAKHLVSEGEKVVSMVHDTPVWTKWLKECLEPTTIVQGDIRDFHFLKRVLNQYQISNVYHLAAQSIVKIAWQDPINTIDINVRGTVSLLEACRQLKIRSILVQSTDKVYGDQMRALTDSVLVPTEPYATSKICTDVIAQSFIKTYGMRIIIARCCNVYGYDWNDRIVPNTIRSCLKTEPPLIFKSAHSKRQYIFVENVADILYTLVGARDSGIFNIASNDVLDQEEVVKKILDFFPGLEPCYIEKPMLTEIKSQSMVPNNSTARLTPFSKGIRKTLDMFRSYGV